jgi:hypothetical protein
MLGDKGAFAAVAVRSNRGANEARQACRWLVVRGERHGRCDGGNEQTVVGGLAGLRGPAGSVVGFNGSWG